MALRSVIRARRGAEKLCQGFPRGCRLVGRAVPMVCPMTDRLRTRIAAAGTVGALGVLAAVALAAGSGGTPDATGSAATSAPEVRTQVERRTVTTDDTAAAAPAPAPAPAPAAPPAASVASHDDDDDRGRGRGRGRGGDDDE
jgi:hypothetical protein